MLEIIETIETHLYRIVTAVIILLVGLLIGLIVKKILRKVLHELEIDEVIKRLGKNYSLERRLSSLVAYLIYFITLILFLDQLKITSIVFYIIIGIILLLLGVTFLLGVRDLIPNLIAGIVIYRKNQLKVGKKIEIDERYEGRIERIGLLEMEIVTKKGDRIHIPNALLIRSKFLLKN